MTSLVERFTNVYSGLGGASATPELAPVRLAMACVAVLPIAGAGISTNQTVDEITTAVVNREVAISRLVAREAEPG